MSFSLVRKHLSQMGSLRPRAALERSYIPMAGPPRFPMSSAQRLIIGVGSLVIMMIIPYWCLFNMPRWSRMHLGLPPLEEQKEEPPPPEAQEETDKDKDKKEKDKKEDKKK
ncbi:uncharacterized protein LOC108033525 [Drosophila biarmipes]|uniref:uncharacterized protein LOC108033525 n=1 Tax=Drosophila biarmipes TaxID=125945 RepID=UPI0007E5C0BD|nr:uncharacterized protein LOC108033525 [Drosophila biarmipes]XP_016963360.1 uncharacterized protein LOC108033525 [Drosophila biarmipes]